MKRSLLALIPVLAFTAVLAGCGDKKGPGPVAAKNFSEYTDEFLKFSIRYPSDWKSGVSAGSQAVFYSNPGVADGFIRYEPKGQKGAKIDIHAMKGGQEDLNKSITELKDPFTDQKVFKEPEQVTLNGMPATKISYSFDVDDTKFTAERFYVMKDSVVTYLETAVIGEYSDYAAIFDSARASFKPGVMAVAAAPRVDSTGAVTRGDSDLVEPPAATMKSYSGQYFSIDYPSNFNPGTSRAGGALASMNFAGARNDSYFQVDVIDPKGADLASIVEQNKRNYGGKAASATKVGGANAFVFNYGGKDVGSRAYFTIAGNGKLYRITVNWFRPQQDSYLPAFEKAVASFKAK
jgi:hypothetical protein